MNVSVRIIVAERLKVVKVPLEALTRDEEDRPIVNVLDGSGEILARRVTAGLANNDSVEIVKGLKAGERVVLPETQAAGEEE
jgi:multidrug efflux pump subunit AcrA (membrane-fusion protein)